MKKILLLTAFLIAIASAASAQRKKIDSLNQVIKTAPDDTNKVRALFELAQQYSFFKPDSGIKIVQHAYSLAVSTKFTRYQRRSLVLLANLYVGVGNFPKAMQLYYDALRLAEIEHDDYAIIQTYNNMGSTYAQMADFPKALQYLRLAKQKHADYLAKNKNVPAKFRRTYVYILNNLAETFLFSDQLDSAALYLDAGIKAQEQAHFYDLKGAFMADLGILQGRRGHPDTAMKYFHQAEKAQLTTKDLTNLDILYFAEAHLYKRINKTDSAIFYAQKALSSAREGNYLPDAERASKLLYQLYDQQHNITLAYKYYKTATEISDSLINRDKIRELASLDFEDKQKRQELAAAKIEYEAAVRSYVLGGGIVVLLLLAFIFWRNARQRKEANNLLQQQKEEIEATLEQLKATQTQLVQSEKMASLGELTAGIAHEIQNPLNFVNNFSEVSAEMIEEMQEELKNGDKEEAIAISEDIKENLQKIRHHGKRADGIVKGMLEHSRASTGKKESTDLNKLADEYLRLAYHGLRAKDKSFNAELITNFDDKLPKVNAVVQDMGRVLLNLFNNAFYAVQQKAKTAGSDYKPTVEITTSAPRPPKGGAEGVVVSVRDNGTGIPDNIKEKIMQPFFTTKPTGEGTGLGLSLSYDIVVKGHGGSISINTNESEGTEMIVSLPA